MDPPQFGKEILLLDFELKGMISIKPLNTKCVDKSLYRSDVCFSPIYIYAWENKTSVQFSHSWLVAETEDPKAAS